MESIQPGDKPNDGMPSVSATPLKTTTTPMDGVVAPSATNLKIPEDVGDKVMMMFGRIPGIRQLSVRQIEAANNYFPGRHVSFGCGVTATANVGGVHRDVKAEVVYHFCAHENHTHPQMTVDDRARACGNQSYADAKSALQHFQPKLANELMPDGRCEFDFRAMAYLCGFYMGRGAFGCDTNLPAPMNVNTIALSEHAEALGNGDVLLTPVVYSTADEYATFCALAGVLGVRRYVTLANIAPDGGRVIQREGLASYCQLLFAVIMANANKIGCGAAHMLAWFGGATSAVTLSAHSDEGGWIRRFLASTIYPTSRGVLAKPLEASCVGLSTQKRDTHDGVLRRWFVLYLTCVRGVSIADEGRESNGLIVPTMCERNEGAVQNTYNSYSDMFTAIYSWVPRFNCWLERSFKLIASTFNPVASFDGYMADDVEDRHLTQSIVVPFWWVDTVPLDFFGEYEAYGSPTKGVSAGQLPMFVQKGVYKSGSYVESAGIAARGSVIGIDLLNTKAREWGASYLYHPAFDRNDGLGQFALVARPQFGYGSTDMVNCDNRAYDLAGRRWSLPDTPLPSPAECLVAGFGVTLDYHCTGDRRMPTFNDLTNSLVTVMAGAMYVTNSERRGRLVTAKYVPPSLRHYMANIMYISGGMTMDYVGNQFPGRPIVGAYHPYDAAPNPGYTHGGVVTSYKKEDEDEFGDLHMTQVDHSRTVDTRGKPSHAKQVSRPRFQGSGNVGSVVDSGVLSGLTAKKEVFVKQPPNVPPPVEPARPSKLASMLTGVRKASEASVAMIASSVRSSTSSGTRRERDEESYQAAMRGEVEDFEVEAPVTSAQIDPLSAATHLDNEWLRQHQHVEDQANQHRSFVERAPVNEHADEQ